MIQQPSYKRLERLGISDLGCRDVQTISRMIRHDAGLTSMEKCSLQTKTHLLHDVCYSQVWKIKLMQNAHQYKPIQRNICPTQCVPFPQGFWCPGIFRGSNGDPLSLGRCHCAIPLGFPTDFTCHWNCQVANAKRSEGAFESLHLQGANCEVPLFHIE